MGETLYERAARFAKPEGGSMPSILSVPPMVDLQHKTPAALVSAASYPPVEGDEIAFALTLFVSAANRTLAVDAGHATLQSLQECEEFFATLRKHNSLQIPPKSGSIHAAFQALWHHYQENVLRNSICARVLGFYSLMERTGGAQIRRWIDQSPDHPESVELHAETVCALATVALGPEGQFFEQLFCSTVLEASTDKGEA